METMSIQVTYRMGEPLAAYIHLGRRPGERAVRSEEVGPEVIADYGADGQVLGLEVVSPGSTTAEDIFAAFDKLGLGRPTAADLRPLVAA